MATTSTAIESKILADSIQSYLQGSDARITSRFIDLSAKVGKGMDSVNIPKISGLQVYDVVAGGDTQADPTISSGLAITMDKLELNKFKEVRDYCPEKLEIESMVEIESAFLMSAPKLYVEEIQKETLSALLANTNTANFLSGADDTFTIANFATAKKKLDEARVPAEGRVAFLNAAQVEILTGLEGFEDASKSTSASALVEGVVARVKGFDIVQYDGAGQVADKIVFAHREALAVAVQKDAEYIREPQRSKARVFLACRGKYGVKLLDAGKRALVMTLSET